MKKSLEPPALWPWGTTAWLPAECRLLRRREAALRRLFAATGAGEIAMPTFDFSATVERAYGHDRRLFRFFDSDGALLALRPEMTGPAARLYATSFAATRPPARATKVFYLGQVFRQCPRHRGLFREFRQAGFEAYGGEALATDAETITLAARALVTLGHREAVIELGHAALVESLLDEHRLTGARREGLITLVRRRNRSGLKRAEAPAALLALMDLEGEAASLAAARRLSRRPSYRDAVGYLSRLAARLRRLPVRLVFEFATVRGIDYYTGMVFEGFSPGVGRAVVAGGRYDQLVAQYGASTPATGFSLELEALLRRG